MTVDARGLSCPEPVLLTQKALQRAEAFSVEVSSASARENVERFLAGKGRTFHCETLADRWRINVDAPNL